MRKLLLVIAVAVSLVFVGKQVKDFVQGVNADFATGSARVVLETLPVHKKNDGAGYDRTDFGPSWKDVDGNGCDTRNDILRRDLEGITYADKKRCVVASGTLHDPYTGKTIQFVRGPNSADVQIDHVVPLSLAWKNGSVDGWDATKKEKFANDPLNLIASDGPANMAKGDSDAAEWLPPNPRFHCQYVAAQIAVKSKYGLTVTAQEKKAMVKVLNTCPEQSTPAKNPARP